MHLKFETKDFKYFVLSIVLLITSIRFLKTTVFILKSNQRFEDLRDEVAELEKERTYINEELEFKKSSEFVEMEARNKLNMLKPNERVYVFDDGVTQKEVLGESADFISVADVVTPNWKLWIELLF